MMANQALASLVNDISDKDEEEDDSSADLSRGGKATTADTVSRILEVLVVHKHYESSIDDRVVCVRGLCRSG